MPMLMFDYFASIGSVQHHLHCAILISIARSIAKVAHKHLGLRHVVGMIGDKKNSTLAVVYETLELG